MKALKSDETFVLELFGLENEEVQSISYSNINETAVIDVLLVSHPIPCPDCGCVHPRIKNYVKKKITHSVLSDRKAEILYHARRYVCPVCGRTYYEKNPFVFKSQKISSKTVIDILKDLKDFNETFSSVARRYYVSPTTVASIFDTHVYVPPKPLPELLNFDEVYAFKSKASKYVCVLLDYRTQVPIDILDSRKKEILISYFMKYPLEERKKVKGCSFDMYDTYRSVMKCCFPNSIGSVDHFHMIQELGRQLDSVRIRTMKGCSRDSDAYYLLKKFNWMLFKHADEIARNGKPLFDLNAPKKYNYHFRYGLNYYELREKLLDTNKDLRKAWDLKEDIVDLYDKCTVNDVEKKLREVIKEFHESEIPEMVAFSRTLAKWKTEIINSFYVYGPVYQVDKDTGHVAVRKLKLNNAIIENRNAIIKCIKKNANGYTNWDRFRNRVLYVLDKKATYSLNPFEEESPSHSSDSKDKKKEDK